MKLILFFVRQNPGATSLAIVVGSLGGLLGAALMALINARLEKDHVPSAVTSAWTFAALVLLILVCGYVSRLLMSYLAERTTFDLRMNICRQIVATPLRQLERTGSSQLLATLTQDITMVSNALVHFPSLCINLAILAGCLIYLAWLSSAVFGIVALFLVLSVLSVKLPEVPATRRVRQAREDWDRLVGHFQAITAGIKELQLHGPRRRLFLNGPLESTAESYRDNNFGSFRIYSATTSWSQVLYFILIGFLLYGLSWLPDVDTDVLVGYTFTCLYLRGPMVQLLDLLPTYSRARIALQKVEQLGLSLAPPHDLVEAHVRPGQRLVCDELELRGIQHSYYREREEKDFTLGPIDLTLGGGELVFLVGGNGSGKTTLAKILIGLYCPESGEVRLNGRRIDDENREWYRQHFSAVFTDFHLFEDLMGLTVQGAELDERARDYLARLQLDHKVQVRNGRLSTTQLSQGQRKRLALLTAYLEDRPIYLFDEWAADQDPQFKEVFYRSLLPELKARGKAVLVISHDDRYYDAADRIIKLDYGRLDYGRLAEESAGALMTTDAFAPVASRETR